MLVDFNDLVRASIQGIDAVIPGGSRVTRQGRDTRMAEDVISCDEGDWLTSGR